jgi:hypothetical protein
LLPDPYESDLDGTVSTSGLLAPEKRVHGKGLALAMHLQWYHRHAQRVARHAVVKTTKQMRRPQAAYARRPGVPPPGLRRNARPYSPMAEMKRLV